MLNLTLEKVYKIIKSYSAYDKGFDYYNQNRVRSLDFSPDYMTFDAIVKGTKAYSVNIAFYNNGELKDANCSCPAYLEFSGYCKHIAAVLIKIANSKDFKPPRPVFDFQRYHEDMETKRNNKALEKIFRAFQNQNDEEQKREVNVEINLEKDMYSRDFEYFLTMKMGEEKLYVVRDIKKVMEAINTESEIEFGKQFTFNPIFHSFSQKDEPIIDMIRQIYELQMGLERGSWGYTSRERSLFPDKRVCLSNSWVKKFLDIMERQDRSFQLSLGDTVIQDIKIVKDDLPLAFHITKNNQDLMLKLDNKSEMIPLTHDGQYVYFQGNIYKPQREQLKIFMPLYRAMAELRGDTLKIHQKDREKFASYILPHAKKAGNIDLDETIKQEFYSPPLEAQIYIDKADAGITVEVLFNYEDRKINPFGKESEENSNNQRVLIRDIRKERQILSLLEQSNLKVMPQKLYIDSDESVFDFIFNMVPILQKDCQIYYSERFKSSPIRNISSFSAGVKLNQETDLLEFSFDMEDVDKSLLYDLFASLRERKKYFKLPDGSFINLDSHELESMADLMGSLDLSKKDFEKNVIEISKRRAVYLDQKIEDLKLSGIVERNLKFREIVNNITQPRDMDFEVPKSLEKILREYQTTGFKWLKTLDAYGLGGILADDMGLGKTLQTISFLQSQFEKNHNPALIVCPTSLVYNWKSEIEKFAPTMKSLVVAGDKSAREELFEQINEVQVVITSYPLIRRDIDSYREMNFSYCILDEAQHIKNPNSLNAKSVKEIKAGNYFALTGTPIENSLTELWSIFDFIMPGYLLSHSRFTTKFERPIIKHDDKKAMEDLKRHISPFILRRLKKDVLRELPDKVEHPMMVDLTKEQKKLYLAYLSQIKGEIDEQIKSKGFEKSHIQILAALTRLRQICCHPSLFVEDYKGDSSKLELFEEVVNEAVEGGHRILVFSQFTSMLAILREKLGQMDIDYLYLDGSTETQERGRLVNEFNDGTTPVFLISLKAGGTGLNLTGADTVIHFDPWWNPAVEDQATDRAHRIGQKNSVHVIKLMTKGTIEEKIYALQQRKKEMIENVIKPGETMITKLSEDEIRGLFDLEQ